MSPAPRIVDAAEPTSGGLDPALLRMIEAMARADARRDYMAALSSPLPSTQPTSHE